MRAFTLDAIGLKLLGKEWKKIFVLNISQSIFTRIYNKLLMAIYKIKEQVWGSATVQSSFMKSAIRQDLGNLMKTVEDLANQIKGFQDLTTQMKEN